MANRRFKISKFTNPSGNEVWRLSGTLNGNRIRKNYSIRSDAVAERQRLEIRRLNDSTEGQTIFTTLTHDQNRDAIAAVNILKEAGVSQSLTFAARYLIDHYHQAADPYPVEKAIEEYKGVKQREVEREIITKRQLNSIFDELATFEAVFGGNRVDEIQSLELIDYFEGKQKGSRLAKSLKTWNNRRAYLSTFFKFCLDKKYIAEDPILAVPKHKIKHSRGTAAILSATQAKELMHWLETYRGHRNKDDSWWAEPGSLIPYFALTLFAGIRPDWRTGEIQKLQEQHINLSTGVIHIEPEVSKVGEKRTIKIQPNLAQWLSKYPVAQYPIVKTRRFHSLWADVRKRFKLPHDVMRHTYISMTVGAFSSVGDAALQAGNSEEIVRKHYLDVVDVTEADEFWRITPQGMSLPHDLEKKDGRYVLATK